MSTTKRSWWRIGALVAASALVFAACGDDKKDTDASAGAGSTTTEVGGATGGATCSGVALGFFGALTGSAANLGINERNGQKLAITQFNKKNPDCQVELKEFDSAGDPAQAPALAQKVVQDASIVAIIGPAFSGESKVADPILDQGGVPLITASATGTVLGKSGWKVFHRAVGNDNSQGPAAAKYLTGTLKTKKLAVLDDASEYGKGIGDIVRTKVKTGGATVAVSESIDPAGTDFSSTVNKIKGANVDAVFFGGYYQAGGVLAKQLKDAGVEATFMGPDGVNDKGFIEAAGAAAEGAILLAPGTPPDKLPTGNTFAADLKAVVGADPGLYSIEAFDATNALLEGITKGHTTRAKMLEFLKTVDHKGLSVQLKFDEEGELAGQITIWASKVTAGKIVAVAPIKS